MTRTEEIRKKAIELCNDPQNDYKSTADLCYMCAEWADENPDEKMIAKYLYEKKGYPIDLNGNLPSFDETMKDAEKYLKYKQDKFIEKACEWLKEQDEMVGISFTEDFIERFQNYMKGYKEMLTRLQPKEVLMFGHIFDDYPGPVHFIHYQQAKGEQGEE